MDNIKLKPGVTSAFVEITQAIQKLTDKRQGMLEILIREYELSGTWSLTPDFTAMFENKEAEK